MMKALDLCGREGGATMGLMDAGFEVTSVDIVKVKANPAHHVVQGDAIEYCREYGSSFDLVYAGWPCQFKTSLQMGTNRVRGYVYPDLIGPGREVMEATGRPWIIENVMTADIRADLVLCGEMFGLGVLRHRKFEYGGGVTAPVVEHKRHRGYVRGWRHGIWRDGPYVGVYGEGGGKANAREAGDAMGICWMDDLKDLAEAIPPAYTRLIGEEVMKQLCNAMNVE